MGNSKNKRYRGNFTDLLYSTKHDDRSARFEVYFSVDRQKLCYKNSDSEVIELEQLSEEQLLAIQNSNNPSSSNTFATMEDVISAGGLQSVVAGTDISIDISDPLNPVISSDFNGIPLTGTEVGSPVIGSIEFKGNPSKTCLSTLDDQIVIGVGNDLNIDENATRKSLLDFTSINDELNSAKITAQDSINGLLAMVEVKTDTSQLPAYQQFININVGGESAGLGAANDHTPFIGDLDYVQKKYVDDLLKTTMLQVDYGDILAVATGSQIFTTGLGTGTASVDLLPTIPIGDLIFVSDLANNASTHNIQIDAGFGNTIVKGDGTPSIQTFIIDSSGQSYTLRKMTSTQYMIIGTNQ